MQGIFRYLRARWTGFTFPYALPVFLFTREKRLGGYQIQPSQSHLRVCTFCRCSRSPFRLFLLLSCPLHQGTYDVNAENLRSFNKQCNIFQIVGIGPDAHMQIMGFRRTAELKLGVSNVEAELLPMNNDSSNRNGKNIRTNNDVAGSKPFLT